ncbi:beta-2-glycoprotein 1-like isoform X3 [Siniperca chuatsi]|uniref:beta-2-glycoprotein 1-like isoform X3 n=1 Tax=Siniperca chuatsi TaxID=119488 RepID=UPI001CE05AB6|nr:beta-2-glycoprotein 1-like isoform X3 [Siniperca chuatsi]
MNVCTFLEKMERMLTLFLLCPFVFFTVMTSAQDNVCFRPELAGNIEMDGLQRYFSPGVELVLSCKQGYTPLLGPRKIVCTASGEWTKTKFMCRPKRCPYPDPLSNGELYYEDTVYQSTINYTCHEGFILTGADTAECLASGTWSTPVPECKPVSCGLAPIPQFGMIVYEKRIRGNTTDYGVRGTYRCLPPYVVIGDARAECTASGKWTKTPECRAPCSVGIQRARILYKGQKMWIKDLNPNKVLHKETVSVYCEDKTRKCGYAVSTQCIDGKLKIPDCFEQPSQVSYDLFSGSFPSEIEQC